MTQRKVTIGDDHRERRRGLPNRDDLGPVRPIVRSRHISTPTNLLPVAVREQNGDFYRLLPRLREGRISFEVFSRKRRLEIPVDPDIREDATREATDGEVKALKKRAATDNQKQEAAEVRVRGAGEKRQGAKVRSSKSGKEGKELQQAADAGEKISVEKARSRKKAVR